MRNSQKLHFGKRDYLYILVLLLFAFVICAAFSIADNDDFDIARKEVLLRKIGHELLLQSGDSTSRVLPLQKIADNEYRISFENNLTFKSDSLVNTTRRLLAKDLLVGDYVVNVLRCGSLGVVYGFAISGIEKDNIVACSGRRQPTACYEINIKFKPTGMAMPEKGYLLGGLPFLAFIGFVLLRSFKPQRLVDSDRNTDMLTLGPVLFDIKERQLTINGNTISLTGTETRLLLIFASSPNETIERKRLQKEIWEDEGIIVGRSLDMFISKLRKKLEFDPNIKIVVIRGKGYKLEINS